MIYLLRGWGGGGGRSHLKKPGYRGEEGGCVGGFSGEESTYIMGMCSELEFLNSQWGLGTEEE
jgi:hypothetical protein